ncbi:DUF2478 domain-containing protein [Comamonadaceae bacterium OH2545_COT-014]|nr:DUF2478 domain-containing protein [Comamonadaceae bacterium OH2545_COT-014]
MTATPTPAPPLAALCHADGDHTAEILLEHTARRLQHAGWPVGGLVHRLDRYPNGNKRMCLHDLRNGQVFEISQDLGGASQACSLDLRGLALASSALRQALTDRVALAVINRFGNAEAEGGGFTQEFAAFAAAGIPVLTAVAARHLESWRRFTGGAHDELPAQAGALYQWCLRQRAGAPA